MKKISVAATLLLCLSASAQEDPYLWLEDVTGQKQFEWVKAQNALTSPILEATPEFNQMRARMLGIATSRAVSYTHLDVYKRQSLYSWP